MIVVCNKYLNEIINEIESIIQLIDNEIE